MDELRRAFPAYATQGTFQHAEHLRDVDLGGRVFPLDPSDGGSPVATPTPAPPQVSDKRKLNDQSHNISRQKRLALPAPDLPAPDIEIAPPEPRQLLHTRLEILEVDLVERQFPESNEQEGGQLPMAHGMFRAFNNGEKILLALQLLAKVSCAQETLAPSFSLPATTPFSSAALTEAAAGPLGRMLAAARVAQQFLENADINHSLLRVQTLMCYITLHPTLEYAVVPQLKRDYPAWKPRRIDGLKYNEFHRLLSGGVGDAPGKLRADIGFGKAFWSLLHELGIAALLMLAVADPGVTVIARAMGPESDERKILTSALSSSRAWWSFAHAIGPATLRTFFGPRDIQYTVSQLIYQLRTEPLPTASIRLLNKVCQRGEIKIGTEPAKEDVLPLDWTLEISGTTVPIMRYPNVRAAQGVRRENVWEWLQSDPRTKLIVDFLLPSNDTNMEDVINFFSNLYNRRSIPRRRAVPFPPLMQLSEPGAEYLTFQERLDILANRKPSNCELLVIPAPVDTLILGLILHPETTTATIYNWTGKRGLEVKVIEVGSLITSMVCLVYTASN